MNKNNEFNLFEVFSIVAKALSNAVEESKKEERVKRFNEGKGEESFDDLVHHLKEKHGLRPIGLKVKENEPLNTAEQPEEDETDADSVIFGLNLNLPMPEELREYLRKNEKARGFFEENTGKQPFTCSGKCCGDDQNDEDELEDDEDLHEDGFDGRVISNETIRDVVDRLAVIEAKMLFGTLLGKELCLEASSDLSKLRKMFEEML
jgi:hypothetical protein